MSELQDKIMLRATLAIGCALMLAMAGCATSPTQEPSAAAQPVATAPAAQNAAEPYGPPLSAAEYRELALGNSLFRPLQNGARTIIYVASDQSLKLRVQAPDGAVRNDVGRESLRSGQVCWQWQHAGENCFHPFWSGRILTFVSVDNSMLPAQFLVQKGNQEGL